MRTFSPTIKQILASDEIEFIFLVKLAIAATGYSAANTMYMTTAGSDISVPALGGTFSSSAGLSAVEAPKLSETVDKETYKIAIIDPSSDFLKYMENSLAGSMVTVWLAFYNTTDTTVDGIPPGSLLAAEPHLLIAYKGRIDGTGYAIDPDNGTIIATLDCASPVSALANTKGYYTSKEHMKQLDKTDTSYDEVYVGSAETAIMWGKA